MKYKYKKELNISNHYENPIIYMVYRKVWWWFVKTGRYFFREIEAKEYVSALNNA